MSGFDVFISYSHTDAALAERLSRRIRRYRPPAALGARPRLTVFRDVERLTAEVELSAALRERIADARHLLLLCSPAAARSPYVDAEVATFLASPHRNALQVVLAEGTPAAAFPPALAAAFQEPLYIDLRPAGRPWQRWRRFRDESLRILAGLLDVDYALLYREDERRSRRQRWLASIGVLSLAAALGSAWLADSVPVDAWARIPVPEAHAGNRLLPAHGFAVLAADPDVRLFLAKGAEWAAHHPSQAIGIVGQAWPPDRLAQFHRAAAAALRSLPASSGAWPPVAQLNFSVSSDASAQGGLAEDDEPELWGRGRLALHAFARPGAQTPGYAWSLHYKGRDAAGAPVELQLPPTLAAADDPFRLDPWPASALIRAGALPRWGYLRGTLTPAGPGLAQALSYRLIDAQESFEEANDGRWIEQAIVSDGDPGRMVSVAGQRLGVADLEPELWARIAADPAWSVARAPQLRRIANLDLQRGSGGGLVASDEGRALDLDAQVLQLLQRELRFEPGLTHRVTQVVRNEGGTALQTLSITTRIENQETRRDEHLRTQVLLRLRDGPWRTLPALALAPGVAVIDALPLGERGVLLLTDTQGLRRSDDGGDSWREFNLGEPALLQGGRVRIVVAGAPAVVQVLLDRRDLGLANPLLRHVQRDWLERVRIGLAQWLAPAAQRP